MLRRILLALAASLTLSISAHATSVLPMYLDEIVDSAAVAFQGTVLSNRTTRDEATGFVVTYTTFKVDDALKGNLGETYTIKQIGGDLPGEGIRQRMHGIPRFNTGESLVVFLYGVSEAGFSSPVGLEQGRFFISDEANGPEVATGRDFRALAKRMAPAAPKSAQAQLNSQAPVNRLPLEDFKKMVRDRVAGGGK